MTERKVPDWSTNLHNLRHLRPEVLTDRKEVEIVIMYAPLDDYSGVTCCDEGVRRDSRVYEFGDRYVSLCSKHAPACRDALQKHRNDLRQAATLSSLKSIDTLLRQLLAEVCKTGSPAVAGSLRS